MKSLSLPGTSHYPTRTRWMVPVFFSVLLLCFVVPASGQCSFDPEDAIPDTLDPLGYYPLDIGNEWHYEHIEALFRTGPSREAILGDSLIDGERFFHIRHTKYEFKGYRRLEHIEYSHDLYIRVERDRMFVHDRETREHRLNFSAPFFSCYEGDDWYWLGQVTVRGEHDASFSLLEDGREVEYQVPALKTFDTFVIGEGYLYGIGRAFFGGEGNVRDELVYARVGTVEYGTPIDSTYEIAVSTEDGHMPEERTSDRVSIYPNPAQGYVNISSLDFREGEAEVVVFDVLGRVVIRRQATPDSPRFVRLNTVTLPAGLYVLHLRYPSGHISTGSFAVAGR